MLSKYWLIFIFFASASYLAGASVHPSPEDSIRILKLYQQFIKDYCRKDKNIWNFWGAFERDPFFCSTLNKFYAEELFSGKEFLSVVQKLHVDLSANEMVEIYEKHKVIQLRRLTNESMIIAGAGSMLGNIFTQGMPDVESLERVPETEKYPFDSINPDLMMNPTVIGFYDTEQMHRFLLEKEKTYKMIIEEGVNVFDFYLPTLDALKKGGLQAHKNLKDKVTSSFEFTKPFLKPGGEIVLLEYFWILRPGASKFPELAGYFVADAETFAKVEEFALSSKQSRQLQKTNVLPVFEEVSRLYKPLIQGTGIDSVSFKADRFYSKWIQDYYPLDVTCPFQVDESWMEAHPDIDGIAFAVSFILQLN